MKVSALIVGIALVASPVVSSPAFAASADTTVTEVTVQGEVVRYEPGRTIVIQGEDDKEVVYSLAPKIEVPEDVKVGEHVTLFTEPTEGGGTQLVTRVVTTELTPEGDVKKTTQDTRKLPSGVTTQTTTTQITGKVETYVAGKTLTVLRSDGTRVTFMINATSQLPADLVVGKTISIVPLVSPDPNTRVVKTVTYVTVPPGQN